MLQPLDAQGLRGELRMHEPMSRHTTWRVGGPAERYYRPADIEDLGEFLSRVDEDEPLTFVGLGSNLLVRDGGIRGTVVVTAGLLKGIERVDNDRVRVEAGVPSPQVARFCAAEGLAGAEFLTGIPGTFGGALAMNAGCFGSETWELVDEVESMDRHGRCHRREPADYSVGYRSVRGHEGEWFIAATLRLTPGPSEALKGRIRELLEKRSGSQPTNQANAGSVFRNPPGDHAARLIDAAGLKGHCIGDACVSEKHANFIVNRGDATAADVEALIAEVAAEVESRFGIELKREVHILGEEVRS